MIAEIDKCGVPVTIFLVIPGEISRVGLRQGQGCRIFFSITYRVIIIQYITTLYT